MMRLLVLWVSVATSWAVPGYDHGFAGLLHSAPAPAFPAPVLPAPIFPAPVIPAPTVIKTFAPPVLSAPVFAPAPIFKTVAPVPIVKQVAPATSYATVTQFITHTAPVVKTVVAPQPILKSFAVAAPLPIHGLPALPALPSFHH